MVFNAIFNNISVILWRSVLLVDTGANHRPGKLDHIMLYRTHLSMSGMEFKLTTSEAIGTPDISHDTSVSVRKTWYFAVLWHNIRLSALLPWAYLSFWGFAAWWGVLLNSYLRLWISPCNCAFSCISRLYSCKKKPKFISR
jgi:hypothetical protein